MRKQRLIDIAKQMAKQDGLINLNCRELCKAARIPHGSFHGLTGMLWQEFVDFIGEAVPDSKSTRFRLKKSYASSDDRKEELMKIAIHIAKRDGYRSVRHMALAEEAGVCRALIYHYFTTKEQLFRAIMRYAVANSIVEVVAQGITARDEQALKAPADLKQEALVYIASL